MLISKGIAALVQEPKFTSNVLLIIILLVVVIIINYS